MSASSTRIARKAFTLIELLVVISIIAVLLSMLIPTLAAAREQAKLVLCQSNLRQIYLVDTYYQNDHRGWMPTIEYSRMAYVAGFGHPDVTVKLREYWDAQVSWCPTIEKLEPGSRLGAPGWETRNLWADNGYNRPRYDSNIIARWLYKYADNPASPTYVRYQDKIILGVGTNWNALYDVDVAGCMPVAMDILFTYPNMINAQYATAAHAVSGPSIRMEGGWVPPVGANMIWPDGQVQFKKWTGTDPISQEYIYIPTAQVAADEGFSQVISGNGGIMYFRRGKF